MPVCDSDKFTSQSSSITYKVHLNSEIVYKYEVVLVAAVWGRVQTYRHGGHVKPTLLSQTYYADLVHVNSVLHMRKSHNEAYIVILKGTKHLTKLEGKS